MAITIDTALAYDPVLRRCDLVFDGLDFGLDATAVTPILMAAGCDRRARPDDALPEDTSDSMTPATLTARRGYPGDALDPLGRLTGSRMWLLRGRKQDEPTRLLAEDALQEALGPVADARGLPMSLMVRWIAPNTLGWQVVTGPVTIAINSGLT